jgi:hypothetical protein
VAHVGSSSSTSTSTFVSTSSKMDALVFAA